MAVIATMVGALLFLTGSREVADPDDIAPAGKAESAIEVLDQPVIETALREENEVPGEAIDEDDAKVALVPNRPAHSDETADAIVWRGTLYDVEGRPIPHVMITLERIEPRGLRDDLMYKKRTNSRGRFGFGGLECGRYSVDLWLPGQFVNNWRTMTFDSPGAVEKDIRLEGGAIEGVIIDEATGRPLKTNPRKRAPLVVAGAKSEGARSRHGSYRNGRFRIECLPPGTYDVRVSAYDLVNVSVDGIEVEEGKVSDGIRILMPLRGRLELKFESLGIEKARATLFREGESTPFCSKTWMWDIHGPSTLSMGVPLGCWTVQVSSTGLGALAHAFEMHEGETIRFSISSDSFLKQDGRITVEGRATLDGMRPLSGMVLSFKARIMGPADEYDRQVTGRTKSDGTFSIEGFRPGIWSVSLLGWMNDMSVNDICLVTIPDHAAMHHTCNLNLKAGSIKCEPVDALTGKPLSLRKNRCRLQLVDDLSGKVRGEMNGCREQDELGLKAVPIGEYRIRVQAEPFENYTSEVFVLHEGQELDLGAIPLRPAATFRMRFMRPEGWVVNIRKYEFKGDPEPRSCGGGYLWMIPEPGSVTVSFDAFGYKSKEMTFSIPSGEYREIIVDLEPE